GARSGFTDDHEFKKLEVVFPEELLNLVPKSDQAAVLEILEQDPRPGYDKGIDREFKIAYNTVDITFVIADEKAKVVSVRRL
ncbi:MAG: tRNA (N6-threonylcarbamoyladenosine(37)-N6)-methyltransferase TrmO, partial [Lachnospiraceae bacterium]|nr:tRNA (N6-threonylcarbamoyladenosine(37)-N6)-methyltransferase TrmO [Lachnospiraceae bacterium]